MTKVRPHRSSNAPETVFGREYNEDPGSSDRGGLPGQRPSKALAPERPRASPSLDQKPFKQKGTGNARAGMTSSPLWRGGDRFFPNMPDENFTQKINKKMYPLACLRFVAAGP